MGYPRLVRHLTTGGADDWGTGLEVKVYVTWFFFLEIEYSETPTDTGISNFEYIINIFSS